MKSLRSLIYVKWVQNVTLGEFLGFLVPSIAGALTVALNFDQLLQTGTMIIAGLAEGLILGLFQARVLKQYLRGFDVAKWITSTIIGAGIAWAIGMLPSTFGEQLSTLPLWVMIPLVAIGAMALLLTIGTAQYLVLRNYITHASHWIWVNVASWLVGLTIVLAVIAIAPDGVVPTILFSAVGGLGMAFSMAAITGIYIQKITRGKS